MKIRQICMVVLLWLGVIPAVQAQSFDKLWKEVEQAGKKSLPKTVIKLTDEIYRKGEKEKNSAQMLKAYMKACGWLSLPLMLLRYFTNSVYSPGERLEKMALGETPFSIHWSLASFSL